MKRLRQSASGWDIGRARGNKVERPVRRRTMARSFSCHTKTGYTNQIFSRHRQLCAGSQANERLGSAELDGAITDELGNPHNLRLERGKGDRAG